MALAIDFVGKLVEIHSFTAPLEEDAYLRDAGPDTGIVPNGKIGRAMAFDRSIGKFAVDTFDGFLLAIAADHLKEFVPKASLVALMLLGLLTRVSSSDLHRQSCRLCGRRSTARSRCTWATGSAVRRWKRAKT